FTAQARVLTKPLKAIAKANVTNCVARNLKVISIPLRSLRPLTMPDSKTSVCPALSTHPYSTRLGIGAPASLVPSEGPGGHTSIQCENTNPLPKPGFLRELSSKL